ncbi:MAG: DNA pilot protein [Microviridae sp.]|nr:MAG: DNA pilot protein [Microviridae sp.]
MAWIAAAPAIASAASGLLGGIMGNKAQKSANQANIQSVREQMAFQERMSGSAHQREVEDLRKAGLNPILSGTGGAGASTPVGAAADIKPVDSLAKNIPQVVSSAMQAALSKQAIRAQTAVADSAETDAKRNRLRLNFETGKVGVDGNEGKSILQRMVEADVDQRELTVAGTGKTNDIIEAQRKLADELNKSLPEVDKMIQAAPDWLQPMLRILVRKYLSQR